MANFAQSGHTVQKVDTTKKFLEGGRVGGAKTCKKGKTMKHEKSENDPKDNQLWCHNIQQNGTNNTQHRSYKYCDRQHTETQKSKTQHNDTHQKAQSFSSVI